MAFATAEARQELLDALSQAADEIGLALASLGAAYEQLDEHTADRLEDELFGPVQRAYGRAKRAHSEFAARHGLPAGSFESQTAGVPSSGAQGFIESAGAATSEADRQLAAIQDSPVWLEVGDPDLRAGLAGTRELLAGVPQRARELVRTLGR